MSPLPLPALRQTSRRLFALGIGVRLLGLALICAGDGSGALWCKAGVMLGVALSVGGIAILRYLLLAGPLSRLGARVPAGFGSSGRAPVLVSGYYEVRVKAGGVWSVTGFSVTHQNFIE